MFQSSQMMATIKLGGELQEVAGIGGVIEMDASLTSLIGFSHTRNFRQEEQQASAPQ